MSLAEEIAPVAPNLARKEELRTLHVLVVEDDAADAHLIERVLDEMPRIGLVEVACDGVEALEYLDSRFVPPDLAIVDLQMPRMDGFKLLIEIGCRQGSDFPIIVLTSSTAPRDVVRSLFRGANHVISKPDSVEALESMLASAINALD